MLLAVISNLRPADFACVVEFGLTSFAFILTFVILGSLDIIKVGLFGSHRSHSVSGVELK
jgi:hypothetical protein